MEKLDCRGQQCPQPVIQARKMILSEPTSTFKVIVDDFAARDNISRMATNLGYTVSISDNDGSFELELTPTKIVENLPSTSKKSGASIVYISSDEMGHGDPKLGQILMKNFIFTLTEGDSTPDAVYFVNNGVRLTVGGSDVIEPLQKLADEGVDIASCGLCLEYFELKDSLTVGRISNMLELVNALSEADSIIRP